MRLRLNIVELGVARKRTAQPSPWKQFGERNFGWSLAKLQITYVYVSMYWLNIIINNGNLLVKAACSHHSPNGGRHSHRHMIFDKLVTNQLFLKYEYIMKKAFKETSAA